MTTSLKLGFIGLGIMGAPMAGHLISAGHQLFVFTHGKLAPEIAATNAKLCASATEVAQQADIVIIMVPDTPDVAAVLFGEGGVAAGLSKGKTVVDMSSISPIETKEFAKKINALGCDYLDAPVSGGEVGAKAASLTIMVGGPEAAFGRVKPLFELMGKNITLVGGNGDGQTCKVANQIIVAVKEQRGGSVPMDQLLSARIQGIPVLDLAAFYEQTTGEVPVDSLKASWLVYGQGFAQDRTRIVIKRLFDIVSSSALLLLASPIMLITMLAIKLESEGPIIYRQERVGLGGKIFMCLKFRSMSTDAEKDGVAVWAKKNDSRVTRVGAFIRKTRIDELPQILSVLKGEMSMVGPRPERPTFVEQLKQQIPYYDIRHSVKPGVTGWAQVKYSYGASLEDALHKHQYDLYYVKNNSLFLDLLILFETVSVVIFREGSQ